MAGSVLGAYPWAMRTGRLMVMTLAWTLFGAMAAVSQSGVVFISLEIDLWPEYDRPGVLVIYRARIAPGVALARSSSRSAPRRAPCSMSSLARVSGVDPSVGSASMRLVSSSASP